MAVKGRVNDIQIHSMFLSPKSHCLGRTVPELKGKFTGSPQMIPDLGRTCQTSTVFRRFLIPSGSRRRTWRQLQREPGSVDPAPVGPSEIGPEFQCFMIRRYSNHIPSGKLT